MNHTLKTLISIIEPSLAPQGENKNSDLDSVLSLADENGLEYALLQNSSYDEGLSDELQEKSRDLSTTIATIDRCANEIDVDYVLIKDCNTVPHLPRDVDILVDPDDKEAMLQSLVESGCEVDQMGEIETALISERGISIDIYTRIQYFDNEFIDVEFLIENNQTREVFETEYRGLTNECELLLHLVHSFFGHRRITLLDFIHLHRIERDGVDESTCIQHADEMGWESTYFYIRSYLSDMKSKILADKPLSFPHLFPLTSMIRGINKLEQDIVGYNPIILFSLWLDGIKLRIENTAIERIIKKSDLLRKLLLRVAYLSREKRGDRYS